MFGKQMRASNDRLQERFIVVVARELAKALKGLHEAGILHRDVKGEVSPLPKLTCRWLQTAKS